MMCSSSSNPTPVVSSCMFSDPWSNNHHKEEEEDVIVVQNNSSWIVHARADDFYTDHVTAPPEADGTVQNNNNNNDGDSTKDDGAREEENVSKPLREKNSKKNGGYKHVPHKDKPPQVVARRNARERRRVQAVNSAFLRLRKAVPIENTRGKRVSKVKTLQNAIQYIQRLQQLLQQDMGYYPINESHIFHNNSAKNCHEFFEDFDFEDEL